MSFKVGLALGVLSISSFFTGCGGGSTNSSDPFQPQSLTYLVFATGNTCSSMDFKSGGYTDSFDSNKGAYAATKQNDNGNLGTNGNLLNEGILTINGTLSTP